jgi:hypothetical protein
MPQILTNAGFVPGQKNKLKTFENVLTAIFACDKNQVASAKAPGENSGPNPPESE